MKLRQAAVASMFYPQDGKELERLLAQLFSEAGDEKEKSRAVVAPHAGYAYSGRTAAKAYSALKKSRTFVILSPNHTGLGKPVSVFPPGAWETPLGKVEVDEGLAREIAGILESGFDEVAHIQEHAVEVQLPFLQWLFKDFRIVAITLSLSGLDELKRVGDAVFQASKGKDIAVIASSDFTHGLPKEIAGEKDREAIKLIEALDLEAFHNLVTKKRLTICGFGPIIAAMRFAKKAGLGEEKAVLLAYDDSSTSTGDESSVVGYAALKFG